MRKDIQIPHLNYTVKVRPWKAPPGSIGTARAWIDRVDRHNSVLYLPDKPNPCVVAHELIHVLQHLCKTRHMDWLIEEEHMAYLMQWLMGQILGYRWSR